MRAGIGIAQARERQVGGERALRLETGIDGREQPEAAFEEAGGKEQEERERDLEGDQGGAETRLAPRPGAGAPPFLQRFGGANPL